MKAFLVPQCVGCGTLLFRHEDEAPKSFNRRRICRTEACKKLVRSKGPQFPRYRTAEAATGLYAPLNGTSVTEAQLFAHRVPGWLLQPVENSVENPATV